TSASFGDKNVGNGKVVGVSGISISGADAGNYSLQNTTASTTANITPATLTVTATSYSIECGSPDPAFSGTYTGQQNGEAFTVGGTCTHSGTGSFTIIPTVTGATLGNYTVVKNNGTLTVSDTTAPVVTLNGSATMTVF